MIRVRTWLRRAGPSATDDVRIVDEMMVSFTHDIEVPWMLPGIAPTGLPVSVAVVAVVGFQESLIASEHIYWDQASVLMQAGLLDASTARGLPVAVDQRGTLTDGPLNQLAGRTRATGD